MKPAERSKLAVLFTLAMARTPLSIPDLAKRTGRSYNTVKKIVTTELQVTAVPGKPTKYKLGLPRELEVEVVRVSNTMPEEGWVDWLRKVRAKFAQMTELDKMATADQVNRQGLLLEALGVSLVSLGRDLQDKASQPDWYSQIGGDEDGTAERDA